MPRNKRTNSAARARETAARMTKPPEIRRRGSSTAEPRSNQIVGFSLPWRRGFALVPVVLAVLTSANQLWNSFAYDDTTQILKNDLIKNLSNLPLLFTTSVWSFMREDIYKGDSYFRPLFTALLTANYAMFGETAWGWHLVSILLHALTTMLVFIVVRELTERKWLALVTALLFAVHPAHAESVAWLSGATDLLLGIFALTGFYFYLEYRKNKRGYLIAIALVSYLLALLSKDMAIVLPIVIAYCELIYFRESLPLRLRLARALMLGGSFAGPLTVYLFMRRQAIGGLVFQGQGTDFLVGGWVPTLPIVVAKYIKLIAVPVDYSIHHYTNPVQSMMSSGFIWPLVLVVIAAAAVWLSKSRDLAFATFWFILWLAPALLAVRVWHPLYLVQERYLYVPSMGFCLAIALGIEWLAKRSSFKVPWPITAAGCTVALVVLFSVLYVNQNRVWHDTITLFQNSVVSNPRSPYPRTALSIEYFRAGNTRAAEREASAALDLDPACSDAYINLSYYAASSGDIDRAIRYLERGEAALASVGGPNTLHRFYRNLGMLYEKRKDLDRAEQYFRLSVETLKDPYAPNWYTLADFYLNHGRYQEARDLFEQTLQLMPRGFAPIHFKLGRVYDRLGQRDQALVQYEKYIELAPYAQDSGEVKRRLAQLRAGQ